MNISKIFAVSMCLLTACCTTKSYGQAKDEKNNTYDAAIIGEMTEESLASSLLVIKMAAATGGGTVKLLLNTPGGDARAALDWIQEVNNARKEGVKLECTINWMSASAGAIVLEAACDIRQAVPGAMILFHGISTQVSGNEANIEDTLRLVHVMNWAVATMVGPRLHMTPEQYSAWIFGRNRWMTAEEALKAGAIDKILPDGCTPHNGITIVDN